MTLDYDKSDEVIQVTMPRKDYAVLREIIEREKTYNFIAKWLKSGWVWTIGTTAIGVLTFWEQIKRLFA